MMSNYPAMHTATMTPGATVTKGRIYREGAHLVVHCPNGRVLKVPGHRPDLAQWMAQGLPDHWPPRPGDTMPGASTGRAARSNTHSAGRDDRPDRGGLTSREVDALGRVLKPKLQRLATLEAKEARAKASARPVATSMGRGGALARAEAVLARVAVAQARAAATMRMGT